MKHIIKILLIFFICNTILFGCINKKTSEIYNIDFFGYKLNYSYNQVIDELNNQNKDYKIRIIENNNDIKFITPKNQDAEMRENLDFIIGIYKNKIFKITKYELDENYFNYLKNKFGEFKIEKIGTSEYYVWLIDNVKISCSFDGYEKKYIVTVIDIANNEIVDKKISYGGPSL